MATFDGKVAWITGGGSGLGRALALEMASRGASVAVSGRRQEKLDEVVAALAAAGHRGLAVPCDVTDEASVQAAVDRVVSELGQLDVCVANAGFSVTGRVERLTAADWRRQFETNVIGVAITARAALPALKQTGGRLALVGSVAAYVTAAGLAPYSGSKAAVRAMGEALWLELQGTGVSCTTIHPGFVESDIARVDNEGVYHADRDETRPAKLLWRTDDAARVMARAIDRRKREFVFTGHGRIVAFLARHTPWLLMQILKRVKV
jgi:NAD(P)-dependent dehydrogenase (short-subunit alcohol dehydrogenase family)